LAQRVLTLKEMLDTSFIFYEYLTAPAPQRPPPKKAATSSLPTSFPGFSLLLRERTLGYGWSRGFQNLAAKIKGGEEE